MKTTTMTAVIVTILIVLLLGFGMARTSGSQSEVETKLQEIIPPNEATPIDPNILNSANLRKIEELKAYGERPDGKNGNFNRPDPFQGI